jgi:hypothetical protein
VVESDRRAAVSALRFFSVTVPPGSAVLVGSWVRYRRYTLAPPP